MAGVLVFDALVVLLIQDGLELRNGVDLNVVEIERRNNEL